uniref:ADP-ribosyl cyclase/cyclic ADP-ribose hydrolase n=1 Tax=Gasterosteus aculeatus aculeatus TaxID=481459 RepID=A0AAQ4RVH7_GASAC|nr:ADP-ribosyl cyclase/cyclic ADP-ribose hydrolase 1-like [Gasterosteus aculeatus aculeatus]XP_040023392.1 ADP-ribosyl cyclase/cyclic ADP-ribose hydrolase 1-like [Gasterosteus aculeatus aculeatus]
MSSFQTSFFGKSLSPIHLPLLLFDLPCARLNVMFLILRLLKGFFISQLCVGQLRAQLGTTPNIKHIVVGRCYNYITLVNPSLRIDCEEIWRRFEESVVFRSSFNATVDYSQMFDAIPQTWPCNTCLFWSKTRNLMHSYAAVERHFWTLEDTLVGFMFNDLVWCGQEKHSGFGFSSCPPWAASTHHPVYSLWRHASQNFAEMACGNITVLLNGSISNAFNRESMFGSVELDGLDPCRVDYVNIKVVTNLEGPFTESCSKGSIADLIQVLRSRGFRWTCTHNDETLMILQCVQNPEQSSCQRCASGFSHGRDL